MTKILTEVPYHISKQVKRQLDNSKRAVIESDQDRIYIITGFEGSGKSTLARQLAYYVDKSFCMEDICFDSEQFAKRIRECKKHKAIIFDEAFRGLSSKGALSKENKKLVKLLIECRQRNLFIFICVPSIFILERYIALFRSHACFHTAVYKKDFKKRYYKVFNRANKQKLYLLGHKMMSYSRPKINLKHRFYSKTPPTIDMKEYGKKKKDSFKESEKEKKETLSNDEITIYIKECLKRSLDMVKKVTNRQLAHLFGRGEHSIGYYLKEIREKL
jgi:predicted ABC-type ATPase